VRSRLARPTFLVPKLCLGTQVPKLCFGGAPPAGGFGRGSFGEAELRGPRSQAELGNEDREYPRGRLRAYFFAWRAFFAWRVARRRVAVRGDFGVTWLTDLRRLLAAVRNSFFLIP